jgi:hypothetical protein
MKALMSVFCDLHHGDAEQEVNDCPTNEVDVAYGKDEENE